MVESSTTAAEPPALTPYDPPDPLGIREATAWVTRQARHVEIDTHGVETVAERVAEGGIERRSWRVLPHWWDDQDADATAHYVLLLDALNFSFWSTNGAKWRVRWNQTTFDGYFALAAALRRALEEGRPLTNPDYLVRGATAATILAGEEGTTIPLLAERESAMREVGSGILQGCGGRFANCISEAEGQPGRLVRLVVERFPSFEDVATYAGRTVPFYKRAQILVSDLWGAFEGAGLGHFEALESLTMFADYKVPQVLHTLGVLRYSSELEVLLRTQTLLPPGDPREVEIRAVSIQAVEAICVRLHARGVQQAAFDLDWRFWALGQHLPLRLPYHRTRTIAY